MLNRKLETWVKTETVLSMLFFCVVAVISVVVLKNSITLSFVYKLFLCLLLTFLLYRSVRELHSIKNVKFSKEEKIKCGFIFIIGNIMYALMNVLYVAEICGYEGGISCTILAIATYTLYDTLVKVIKNKQLS